MKILLILMLLLATPWTLAQEPKPKAKAPLSAKQTTHLVEELGSADFGTREAATRALKRMGEAARPLLEQALQSRNPERRTRARSLLRVLDQAREEEAPRPLRRLKPLPPDRVGPPDSRSRAEEALRSLQETMRAWERRLRRGDWWLPDPRFLQPMPEMPRLEPFFRALGPLVQGGRSSISLFRNGEQLQFSRDEKGAVEFKITRLKAHTGKNDTAIYQAGSLEEFKKNYPEIYKRYAPLGLFSGNGGFFSFRIPPKPAPPTDFSERRGPVQPRVLRPSVPGGQLRLKVLVSAVPEALRAQMDLPERALMVDQVEPSGLGERLGLKRFDILTQVNGGKVQSAGDVRAALNPKHPPATLQVEVMRKGRVRKLALPWPGGGK